MTLMKAKKPLALLLALLAALSLLGTTALAAGLPEETIAAQTELCGEDCGHTHEEVFSHTEHAEESLPEPEEIAVPVATPLLEQPEPEAEQPSDTSGVIPGSGIYWELNEYGWLMLSGNGSCPTFVSPDDQPWAAVREQITQVWFEDMDALSIPSLAYWFTGCTALTMAEIPYTTPVIGAAAFADCPSLRQIQLYYSGTFTIVPGAFSTGSLTPLLVLFIPEYDSVLGTLAAYDWTEDRRAAYFEDVYGITLLATGYCSNCKRTCSYTVEYEQWTNSEHCVRHWCSNCGYDQAGGVNGEAHSFRSGVCSKCGYSNGSGGGGGGGGNVCYHSSTRTSWSGCDWYEYCRSCGALVDYGTSHGTYVYGAWEYYSSSQHRRSYACSDCGEGTYRYASHSVSTQYAQYIAAQHRTVQSCSVCNATLSSSYSAHTFTYGTWQSDSATQHRRTKTCSACGYSEYEYAAHSLTAGAWQTDEGANYSTRHKRLLSCACGYSRYEYAAHQCTSEEAWQDFDAERHTRHESCLCGYERNLYTYHVFLDTLTLFSDTEHTRTRTCECGRVVTAEEAHAFQYGAWQSVSDTEHRRAVSCDCGYNGFAVQAHLDGDSDGYCDDCGYLLTRFSVIVPAGMTLTVSKTGTVYAASNVRIVNRSTGAVSVISVTLRTENGWTLVPFSTNMATEKVDSRKIGFSVNGAQSRTTGAEEALPLGGGWRIPGGEALPLHYDAVVSAASRPISEQVLTVIFVLEWAGA